MEVEQNFVGRGQKIFDQGLVAENDRLDVGRDCRGRMAAGSLVVDAYYRTAAAAGSDNIDFEVHLALDSYSAGKAETDCAWDCRRIS